MELFLYSGVGLSQQRKIEEVIDFIRKGLLSEFLVDQLFFCSRKLWSCDGSAMN